ncbi:MAG TPA: AAA family ATPase [Patescibacteria group bacterium]|nr:AAA family ATPase [Patescibacteria group bacterium]
MTSGLLGRRDEANAVDAFLDRVPAGPMGLLIEGDPGIGKTALWLDLVSRARARGYRVLQARPAERERDLSFAALGDLLRDVLPTVDRRLPEPQRVGLHAALLLAPPEASVDFRTTATGLVSAILALADDSPLLVAIDDVHWLDPASERALAFALRRLPSRARVVLARRIDAGGRGLDLAEALGRDAVTEIRLGPLPGDVVRDLVSANEPRLSRSTLARVAGASLGNPFHALEITRTIRGRDIGVDEPLPIPSSLDGLVRERLERLSDRARAAATAVAVAYRPSRTTVAAALGPNADVDTAVLEAEEAGVLAWEDERLRFTHPLLGSALYGGLSTSRRRALHRRLAEAAQDHEERAHHLVGSISGANEGVAREIEKGADIAERRGAVDAAAGLYRAARDRTPPDDRNALARRSIGAARALLTAGDIAGARRFASDARAEATAPELRAEAMRIIGVAASYAGTIEQRIAAHEAALAEADGDPSLKAQLLVDLGERITIDPWKAARSAGEAARMLREMGDEKRLAQALIHTVMASAVLGHGAPSRVIDEVRRLEAAAPARRVNSLIWFHWLDDLDATRARYDLQVDLARQDGDDYGVAELAEFMAMVDFRAGSWATAERLLEDACRKLAELDIRGPLTASFADRSVVDAHRGRIERARSTLRGILDDEVPQDTFWIAVCLSALGAVEFAAGDLAAADGAWTAMRQSALSVGWLEFPEDRSEPDHIEALLVLGELARARDLLAHLEWRGRTIPRAWIDATLPRARALVLSVEGQATDALASLEAADPVHGFPFERARLLMVRGQLERRANRKLAARRSLEDALAIFEELGSPPWVERTRAEIGRLGLRHRDRHELTAMERRIAELAATGLTNRQVADAAFVSAKTVEANLARVYGKLGIRSRAELGARMAASSTRVDAET